MGTVRVEINGEVRVKKESRKIRETGISKYDEYIMKF